MSGVCFCGTSKGVEGEMGAGRAHPGLQLSDTSRATLMCESAGRLKLMLSSAAGQEQQPLWSHVAITG